MIFTFFNQENCVAYNCLQNTFPSADNLHSLQKTTFTNIKTKTEIAHKKENIPFYDNVFTCTLHQKSEMMLNMFTS